MNLHILKELYILLIVCHLEKIEENWKYYCKIGNIIINIINNIIYVYGLYNLIFDILNFLNFQTEYFFLLRI